tara:strand:- start:323 stop:856 length:534 start_codon:yes stop_codon:yes gene_type:complete
MSSLKNQKINEAYQRLLQVDDANNWVVMDGTGSQVAVGHLQYTSSLDGNVTLKKTNSGVINYITHASNAIDINLPAPSTCVGCEFTFIMRVSRTVNVTVDSNSYFKGFSDFTDGNGIVSSSYISRRYLIYDESLGNGSNGNIGDRLDINCDGQYYYFEAKSYVANGGTAPVWSGSSA